MGKQAYPMTKIRKENFPLNKSCVLKSGPDIALKI